MSFTVGEELASRTFAITRDSLVKYAGASGDFNPIHYRDDVAAEVGLPGVLAHGMLTMGLAASVLDEVLTSSTQLLDYGVRFAKPVVVPASGSVSVTVTAKVGAVDDEGIARIDLAVVCDEVTVLTKAQARIAPAA